MVRMYTCSGKEQALTITLFSINNDQKIYTPKMSQENGEVVGPDTIKKSACISANPEDHVKFIQQYIDLGFNYLIFHSAGPNHRAFIEGYGRDVLPRLRSRVGTASRV